MNRSQRRAQKKQPPVIPDCVVPKNTLLNNGDIFTITGVQRLKDGTVISNCKPGKESTWTAKIEEKP